MKVYQCVCVCVDLCLCYFFTDNKNSGKRKTTAGLKNKLNRRSSMELILPIAGKNKKKRTFAETKITNEKHFQFHLIINKIGRNVLENTPIRNYIKST